MKKSILPFVGAFLLAPCAKSFVPLQVESRPTHPLSRQQQARKHHRPINNRSTSKLEAMSRQDQTRLQANGSSENENPPSNDNLAWLLTLCLPLWLVYVSNQWSRASIYYLVDFSDKADAFKAMNIDIGFSEAQYGLLASIAFTALYAIASLGAGVAADRFNRKVLTTASAVSWAVATLGTATAETYTQVVLCRIAMGLACAFSTPTAYTLIRERAPTERVALATSLYGTGVAVASALSSLSILLDTEYGWRNALVIVSVFGFVAAATCLLVLEDDPVQQENDNDEAAGEEAAADTSELAKTFVNDLNDVVATKRVQWIFIASFLRFCSGLCIGVWGAPYFRMAFPTQQSEFAVAQAAISAIGASVSGLLGGAAADWVVAQAGDDSQDAVGRRLWIPVVGSILAAPTWYFAVNSDGSFETAMLWLAAEYFVAECWFGPTISTLQSTVAPKVGGTAQGAFTLTGGLANLAPSLLGYLYGQASGGTESSGELAGLLAFGVCFGYLSSAVCFAIAAQSPPPSATSEIAKTKMS